jgi:hypothetical protein
MHELCFIEKEIHEISSASFSIYHNYNILSSSCLQ